MPLTLGEWRIETSLGAGGLARVWRARHARFQDVAAVKILDAAPLAGFPNEVRALAGLDHPNIVRVLDYGRVSAEEAEASEGVAKAGVPWFVLPLAHGGTAEAPRAPTRWAEVHAVARCVLRGLAHAHAAGLIHRDVKPSNVLLPAPGAFDRAILADFGLAGRSGGRGGAGTPSFMAPEQFDGDGRVVDARTDLYGLGALVWALVAGDAPYGAGEYTTLRAAHRGGVLPGLTARMPVPPELEALLRWLLTRAPADRPASAAEALRALDALGPPEERAASRSPRFVSSPTLVSDGAPRGPQAATWSDDGSFAALEVPSPTAAELPGAPPPAALPPSPGPSPAAPATRTCTLPPTWRTAEEHPAPSSAPLLEVLRPAFVGREAERDTLWETLRTVPDGPRLVFVEGPSGSGRSRLVEWFAERVHAEGAAVVLRATHGERWGPDDGIPGLLARFLRAEGLGGTALLTWLRQIATPDGVLQPAEVDALAERIAPQDPPRVRFRDAAERLQPALALTTRAACPGPALVVLDDAHFGTESLALAEALLDGTAPVLVVVTLDPAALFAREDARAQVDRLRARPHVPLVLGPLAPADMRRLVERGFGLAPSLAAGIEDRAQGSPLVAVELAREAARRGLLVQAPTGLALAQRGLPALPTSLAEAWEKRLAACLSSGPPEWRDALEIAMALGASVDAREWRQACAMAGFVAPDALVEAGLRRGLLVASARGPEVGWSFAHAGLREALDRDAHASGRASRWHAACADALMQHARMWAPERLATHLVEAGRPEEALPWCRRAVLAELDSGDRRMADRQIDRMEAAMDAAGLPNDDARRIDARYLRARTRRLLGDPAGAFAAASIGRDLARVTGQEREEVLCAGEMAEGHRLAGRLHAAEALLAEAEALAEKLGDRVLLGMVAQRIGTVAFERGATDAMLVAGRRARTAFEAAGDRVSAATALNLIGCGLASAGRMEEARATFAATLAEQEALGCRWGAADAANNLGFALQELGRPDEAVPILERSVALWGLVGSPLDAHPLMNLAFLHLQAGRFAEAAGPAAGALRSARRLGWGPNTLAQALATAYAAQAGLGDPLAGRLRSELDAALARAESVDPIVFRIRAIGDRRG